MEPSWRSLAIKNVRLLVCVSQPVQILRRIEWPIAVYDDVRARYGWIVARAGVRVSYIEVLGHVTVDTGLSPSDSHLEAIMTGLVQAERRKFLRGL